MDRLILLRHGQADPGSESGEDFDRRLAPHGIVESRAMGLRLAEMGFVPDLALVSTAARARDTWDAAGPAFPNAAVRYDDDLYHAFSDVVRAAAFEAEAVHEEIAEGVAGGDAVAARDGVRAGLDGFDDGFHE